MAGASMVLLKKKGKRPVTAEERMKEPKGRWIACRLKERDMLELEEEGMLPPKDVSSWRRAFGDELPNPQASERVVLKTYVERGLSFPPSEFFTEVMDYFGLQLHHRSATQQRTSL